MDSKTYLEDITKFTKLLHKFQSIKRTIYVYGEDRLENDAEHSYQLALTAWYLINKEKLGLNTDLVIKYSLIHDLPEVYAGDPYFYSEDNNKDKQKRAKEKQAVKELQQEFPGFKDFFKLIDKYEKQHDEESKFVYALDKVLPMINELINSGKSFKHYSVTPEQLRVGKEEKVKVSVHAKKYYDLIIEIFINEEEEYFYNDS